MKMTACEKFHYFKPQQAHVSAAARGVCNAGGGRRPGRSGTLRLRRLHLVCPGPGSGPFAYPRAWDHKGVSPRRVVFQAAPWQKLLAIFLTALPFRFETQGYL